MSDNDPTRTAPPESAATRSAPNAPEPSPGGTISYAPATPGSTGTVSFPGNGDAPVQAGAPEVPGYELLEELGRGAMGVVYKARDLKLNRVVALKMVLGDERADPKRLIRFLAEAEAVAAVRHPHVVQVYEFGEASGRPFIAFEYLAGGKLTERLGAPLPPKDAAELVSRISRGVAAAHEQGIVHRDLKPGNVLFDEAGAPRVTDFGLAKRGSVSDLTATQAVMGTPAYMSPEQASGSAKFVGPQADVWALGVILYEALTGSRPFDAEDVRELLTRIMTTDPGPPRKRLAAVPRDLELVCLKCLSKPAYERYPTARELADDLDRFVRGEPISIRPAGPLERGYKWVRRNKVLAGAIAAVSLALLVGAGASLTFGLEARKQEKEALKQKKEAEEAVGREEREKHDAVAARNDLKDKNDQLLRSQERVKRTLAKALLGPITAKNRDKPLTPYEVEAFWQLAELRRDEVTWMFLEEVTGTPLSCDQLACRAEGTLHATIGLDPARCRAADQLLLARVRERLAQGDKPVSLALSIARSDFASSETAVTAFHILAEALPKEPDDAARRELSEGLAAVVSRMEPGEAARVCSQVAPALVDALIKETNPAVRVWVARGLAAMAARMEPAEATKVCTRAGRALVSARAQTKTALDDRELAWSLIAVAPWMEPTEAIEVLADAVTKEPDSTARTSLAEGLVAAVKRMAPASAAQICARAARTLTDALAREKDPSNRVSLAQGLVGVVSRMEPAEAAKICARVATTFADAIATETNARDITTLAQGLETLAEQMEPAEAAGICARAARTLADAFDRETNPHGRLWLGLALAVVTRRMEPAEAAGVCARATRTLADALAKETDRTGRYTLAQTLAVVATRMEPAEAARILADALTKEPDADTQVELAEGLGRVAGRMEPAVAAKICAPVARALLDKLAKQTETYRRVWLARGLGVLTARLERPEGAKVCTQAVHILATAHATETNGLARGYLTDELVVLTRRMEPVEAVGVLTAVLAREPRVSARVSLARGLVAAAARIEPAAASTVFSQAVRVLADTFGKEQGSDYPLGVERVLVAAALGISLERDLSHCGILAGAFATPHNILPSLPLLHSHFRPQPRPLPPQDLVELLKHPFCVDEVRRAVLDVLEFTYKRPFKDQWEFVESAQKHQPQLDLLTPPKRPEPKP